MLRFLMGIAGLSTAKTIFWERSGLLIGLAVLGFPKLRVRRPTDVALKEPSQNLWRPTATVCQILSPLFPNCGIPDLRSVGRRRRPIECPSRVETGQTNAKDPTRLHPPT
jgi:hypothetical protein